MGDEFGDVRAPSIGRHLLRLAQGALYWVGAANLYGRLARSRFLPILMYHSVAGKGDARWIAPRNRVTPRRFEAQMRFLARHRRVISLDVLLDLIRHNHLIPRRAVLLTFDDGYRDNLDVVAPILQRYHLPAVLYLCTGYINRGENQWADVLYSAIRYRRYDRLALEGQPPHDLGEPAGRDAAYHAAAEWLLSANRAARDDLLRDIVSQLQPERQPTRQTLTWDEVRRLASEYPGFALGVHTADHLDLSSLSVEEAIIDIRRSIEQFEVELVRSPEHFSFPYGRATADVARRLGELGIRSAMTGEGMLNRMWPNPLDLCRLEAPQRHGLLRYWTSGAHPCLSLKLFGRA